MSEWIARRIWWGMLWWMRRPFIRRMQRGSLKFFPEGPKREKALANFRRQERLARRYGEPLIRFVVFLFLVSVGLTWTWLLCLEAFNRGWLPLIPSSGG